MRFTKRRTEYLLRRWAGKQAVAQVLGMPREPGSLARVQVLNHETGAPYALVDGAPVAAAISLTDRAGWALCAVLPGGPGIGCDLEVAEPRSGAFVTDFLTTPEQEYVDALAGAERDTAANVVWSAKESGLKLLGTGLRRDSRSVEVRAEPGPAAGGWAPLSVEVDHRRRLAGWWCREGAFVLTVVTAQRTGAPVRLAHSADLRSAEPLHSWQERPLAP
jgi:4'-phosphopantetheinyl transferase